MTAIKGPYQYKNRSQKFSIGQAGTLGGQASVPRSLFFEQGFSEIPLYSGSKSLHIRSAPKGNRAAQQTATSTEQESCR